MTLLYNVKYNIIVFKADIRGCYFHLSQSMYRKIGKYGLIAAYSIKNSKVRRYYKYLQTLAFIPSDDVEFAFSQVKKPAPALFSPMTKYFERYYIGPLKKGSKTIRTEARYPIATWNVYERTINDLPRTNNSTEAWHNQFAQAIREHPSSYELIEEMLLEQKNTEYTHARIRAHADNSCRFPAAVTKDAKIKKHVGNYNRATIKPWMEDFILFL